MLREFLLRFWINWTQNPSSGTGRVTLKILGYTLSELWDILGESSLLKSVLRFLINSSQNSERIIFKILGKTLPGGKENTSEDSGRIPFRILSQYSGGISLRICEHSSQDFKDICPTIIPLGKSSKLSIFMECDLFIINDYNHQTSPYWFRFQNNYISNFIFTSFFLCFWRAIKLRFLLFRRFNLLHQLIRWIPQNGTLNDNLLYVRSCLG